MNKTFLSIGILSLLSSALAGQTPDRETKTIPLSSIQIRDPFFLPVPSDSTYYLFGTNRPDPLYRSEGFFTYSSKNMADWEGPFPAFLPGADFWGGRNYWAAECHPYKGKYYMFGTVRHKADSLLGTAIFVSRTPKGPYTLHSEGRVTPKGWNALDGTLYVDKKSKPWMVFCHEWTQIGDGTVEAVRLTGDLKAAKGKPVTLFSASQAPWVRSHQPGKEFYVTDGPFLFRNSKGELLMLWSSFTEQGYAIGIARSQSGDILGPWEQIPEPLFVKDGGHGMVFRTFDGRLLLSIHRPNRTPEERTRLFLLRENMDGLPEIASEVTPERLASETK